MWEAAASLGRDRELLIVTCKKWHVAKRLLGVSKHTFDLKAVEYLFNELNAELPDLGGIESALDKRTRHRRALLRMLFDHFQTERLAICLDPSDIELMRDFFSDTARTRMLEIGVRFSDDYLIGHAHRVGLAGAGTTPDTIARLLPTLRQDMQHDQDRIRDAGFADFYRIDEDETADTNAGVLAEFFRIPWQQARDIMDYPGLFAD